MSTDITGEGEETTRPAKVPASGFCIYIRRLRQEQRSGLGFARTVGDYQCYSEGEPLEDLSGQMVERSGPGNNGATGKLQHRRIEAGTYPLAIQDGERYKTFRYASAGFPFPGLALEDTGERSAILLHPCHDDDNGYVSSIGCINPTVDLEDADSRVDLEDSRIRVIAIIDAMKRELGDDFPKDDRIPGAVIVIEGEPV